MSGSSDEADSRDTDVEVSDERSVSNRLQQAGGNLASAVSSVRGDSTKKLKDTLSDLGRRVPNLTVRDERITDRAAEITGLVASEAQEYIAENEVELTVSGHHVRIEGDEEGLEKIKADLDQALKGKDVNIEYHNTEGLKLNFADTGREDDTT